LTPTQFIQLLLALAVLAAYMVHPAALRQPMEQILFLVVLQQ
jgi:hypothetical protein